MPDLVVRTALGVLAGVVVALAARRAGSLTGTGALAAVAVGTAAVVAGWAWGALLILYFVASSALSHAGRADKERLIGGMVAKGGARDAMQVLANGGVFALFALLVAVAGPHLQRLAAAAGAGALAAATADTWATEVGVHFGGRPRALLTLRPAPPGTSGAVSLPGTGAMVAGALAVALVARALGISGALVAITVGGCAGALADTLIGGTLQERRWCDACTLATERPVHDCGAPTRRVGGWAFLDNDAVNLLATAAGAAVALLLAFQG